MNTEQTEKQKSLGQICEEAYCDGPELGNLMPLRFAKAADAVATEVLQRLPEWSLLDSGMKTVTGDECWSWELRCWMTCATSLIVDEGDIIRRRISSVPEQKPQSGNAEESPSPSIRDLIEPDERCPSCDGGGDDVVSRTGPVARKCPSCNGTGVFPPPAPRAERKPRFAVGDKVKILPMGILGRVMLISRTEYKKYFVNRDDLGGVRAWWDEADLEPAPWKLPEPPEHQQWHRTDWTQEMLPQGWRPLLKDEFIEVGDECLMWDKKTWRVESVPVSRATPLAHHRTTRPLPTPPVPQPEDPVFASMEHAVESAKYWEKRFLQTMAQRDVAVSQSEEKQATIARLTDVAMTLISERDELKVKLAAAEKLLNRWRSNIRNVILQGDKTPMDDETLRDRAYKAIDARVAQVSAELAAAEQRAEEEHTKGIIARDRAIDAESQRDKAIDNQNGFYAHLKKSQDELAAARALVPVWVPVPKDLPQRDKGQGDNRLVAWLNLRDEARPVGVCWMDELRKCGTHYHRLPPLPVETGGVEDEVRKSFEEWAIPRQFEMCRTTDGTQYSVVNTRVAYAAWQAALSSTKP